MDAPIAGKLYSLTGMGKSIANGNTWEESCVRDAQPTASTLTLKDFTSALDNFMTQAQSKLDSHYVNYPTSAKTLIVTIGKRFVKVIAKGKNEVSGSAFAFIDIANGDIFKVASWNAPAKHARGNIYNPNFMDCVTPYGIQYLRG